MVDSRVPTRWPAPRRRIPAAKLNEPVDILRRQAQGVNAPRQKPLSTASTQVEVRRFQLVDVYPDYLVCRSWDGYQQGDEDIFVARPPRLRGSETSRTFSGGTVTYSGYSTDGTTRTATLSGDTESQLIVPEYVENDEIVAARNVKGGTGATRTVDGVETPIVWLDLNVDGRAWAKAAA